MFYVLFALIDAPQDTQMEQRFKLSDKLQQQKKGLKMMMWLVLVSYFLSAVIFYFYGSYHDLEFLTWFKRWMAYPLLAIVIELPNMLVIYIIHWQTYKPKK